MTKTKDMRITGRRWALGVNCLPVLAILAISCGGEGELGGATDGGMSVQAQAVITATGLYKVATYPSIMRYNSSIGRVCYVTGEEWTALGSPAPTIVSLSDMDTLLNSHPPTGKTCSYEEVGLTSKQSTYPATYYRAYSTNSIWAHEIGNYKRACWVLAGQYANLGNPSYTQLNQAQTTEFLVAFGPRDGTVGYCENSDIGVN
jgi:hypothetical protein